MPGVPLAAVQPDVPAPLKLKGKTVRTKNVVGAVRSRLGALGRGRTAPTEAGAVAPKRRPRRLIVLALAATLAALPISAAVQTVGAPKAQAAVDGRYAWIYQGTAAMTAFNFWRNGNWPATGPQNAQFNAGNNLVINGGGTFNDDRNQLRIWLAHMTGHWGGTFREYDAAPRPRGAGRGAARFVLNLETGVIFHSDNHYVDFTPLNFGNLRIPYFPSMVHCYEHPAGQENNRRITLHNGGSNPVSYSVDGVPATGMAVRYHLTHEWWHSGDRTYYVDGNAHNYDTGNSFEAFNAIRMHQDPNEICHAFTGFWYGSF